MNRPDRPLGDPAAAIDAMGQAAKAARQSLVAAPREVKDAALDAAATALGERAAEILSANAADIADARAAGLAPAMIDRLALDTGRIAAVAGALRTIAGLPDPVGTIIDRRTRPNGLVIERVRVPLGVIGVIYESRPNVTADAGALALKAGNAVILRGGSESRRSSAAIHECLLRGLAAAGLPEAAIQLVATADRAAVGAMLTRPDLIDVIVPRGGKSLVARIQAEARVPVLAHLDGNCHTYIHSTADPAKARALAFNAKMRRTGICGATETLLVDAAVAAAILPAILDDLSTAGCEIRGDAEVVALDRRAKPATTADWDTEYLDAILAIRVVDGIDDAIAHIARHGSHHTEAIVTEDTGVAERFLNAVDSAIVMVNASTQFADGGEFGLGAEIGISTGRLHARGPVGLEELTTYKYLVRGTGQVRP